MGIYIITNIIILVMLLFEGIIYLKYKNKFSKNSNSLVMLVSFFTILFVSSFRGDFTTDYNTYLKLFEFYNQFNLSEITLNKEIGYLILNKLIGIFTKNGIYLFVVTSLIIIGSVFKEIKRESSIKWLSILLFINIGSYYTSFNIMRQILSAAIIFAGSKYLYNRNFLKYCLIVFIASLFHQSSLIMLPFYFILNIKFDFKSFLLTIVALIFVFTNVESILNYVQKYFYSYYDSSSYGMTGLNYTNVVIPLVLAFFVVFHKNIIKNNNIKYNVWINSTIFYAFFSILGLKIQMLQRFSYFFQPYIILIVPYIISNIKNKEVRILYLLIITILLIIYNYITLNNTGYDPYYFFWE